MSASVLVLYNEPVLPPHHPQYEAERDVLDTVAECTAVLREAGYAVRTLGLAHDLQPLLDEVRRQRPDAVFNLHEGVPESSVTEVQAAALLEWLGLPYTGCPARCLALGRDKAASKYLLRGAGLPTPPFALLDADDAPHWTGRYPLIVKPTFEDASIGIEQDNVVTTPEQLPAAVARLRQHFPPPLLLEELLPGREFHVNVLELGPPSQRRLLVLPPGEIVFQPADPRWHPVYTYTAKWDTASGEYQRCLVQAPVTLDPQLQHAIDHLARRAFRLFHCRDYARLDIRLDAHGQPHILEVNPNPYLISLILVNALQAAGYSFEWLILELLRSALDRAPRPALTAT